LHLAKATMKRLQSASKMSLVPDQNSAARRHGISRTRLSRAQRSRITNSGAVLPEVDGRSAIARRYRDIASAIVGDQGGIEHCSESRQQLIRRFAAAAVIAEQLEAGLARGERINVVEHCQLASTMVRIAHRIGVDRVPKDIVEDAVAVALREEFSP
jgi:hypothetical protein